MNEIKAEKIVLGGAWGIDFKICEGIVPIENIIGNQGAAVSRQDGKVYFESGYVFRADEISQGRYKTVEGLEAIYSKRHGLLLFLSIREGIKNGAYFHPPSIYAHWEQVEAAASVVVRERIYDTQDRPDKRQEICLRFIYSQQALRHALLAQNDPERRFKGFCGVAGSILSQLLKDDSKQIKTVSLETIRETHKTR